jgi:hypothetical protein
MVSVPQLVVSALFAATVANSQSFDGTSRSEDAFSYVQPENTTILGPYGHSPAIYPSRTFFRSMLNLHDWVIANFYHSERYLVRQLGGSLR